MPTTDAGAFFGASEHGALWGFGPSSGKFFKGKLNEHEMYRRILYVHGISMN